MKNQNTIAKIREAAASLAGPASRAAIQLHETRPAYSAGIMSGVPIRLFRALALIILLMAASPACLPAQPAEGSQPGGGTVTKLQNAVDSLANIQQSIEAKRDTIRELREGLKDLEDTSEAQKTEQKIARIKSEITSLQLSFEHIALGGINPALLAEDEPVQKIDWRDELEQISRPLLSTLKELTAKPREMDSLRREIDRLQEQQKLINKALGSLGTYRQQALAPLVAEPVNQLLAEWEQRRDDTERALEIARFKYTNLKTDSTGWQTSTGDALAEFFLGRGLTLLLAVLVSVAVWLLAKGLLWLYWRWLYRTGNDLGVTRAPLVMYGYRLATAIVIVLAILMVFYIRGDVLLLTLALIALAGVALSLRQTLPRYTAELRLLLGIGPVREKERLVYDGVPYMVESLSMYSVLRNPALEGVVRLPLHNMNGLASRPAGDEPWFPCQPGEFIVLANGSFGRVLRQTIEQVEMMVLDSLVQIRTRDFLGQSVRNLSRDGFGVATTFGIDYRHQAICLDTVPERLRAAIVTRFEQAGMKADIVDLLVEFKTAGASSLDYQLYVILNGRAAKSFFRAQRMIQQACVDACNREGWVIPFTQITVHSE